MRGRGELHSGAKTKKVKEKNRQGKSPKGRGPPSKKNLGAESASD